MRPESDYFDLSLDSLRVLGAWTADCAERVLGIFERRQPGDPRPRTAIEGIRVFAAGGRRTAELRKLALDANAAAREVQGDEAAVAAARSAGLAAASAYTHPLADVHQTVHILGPAAYAALAIELDRPEAPGLAEQEIRWAIESIRPEARDILLKMPARQVGKSRLDRLLYELDRGIRSA